MAQHTHDTRLQIVSHTVNALLQSRHIALMKEAFKEKKAAVPLVYPRV